GSVPNSRSSFRRRWPGHHNRRAPGPAVRRLHARVRPARSSRAYTAPRHTNGGARMGKLEGKVALVTGSGRNIGRATVLKLAGEGAHVVVNARENQAEADAVAQEARARGVKALSVIADVGKQDQVDRMVKRAMSEF